MIVRFFKSYDFDGCLFDVYGAIIIKFNISKFDNISHIKVRDYSDGKYRYMRNNIRVGIGIEKVYKGFILIKGE